MNQEDLQKIHAWLGGTGEPIQFQTWDGMRLLLEGLRQKNIGWNGLSGNASWALNEGNTVVLFDANEDGLTEAYADTLPLALTQAVLKLMEQEEKDGK